MEKNNEISLGVIKSIVIIGPESTGKTTLSEQLASHYKTLWVPEYAREYIGALKRKYTVEDIETIAKRQIELEEEKSKQASDFLFCDTDLIVCKVWAEHAFGKCPQWILDEIEKRNYAFYLLANIDLPWVADSQREHAHLRTYFLTEYKRELEERNAKYEVVSGIGKDRLKNALQILNKYF